MKKYIIPALLMTMALLAVSCEEPDDPADLAMATTSIPHLIVGVLNVCQILLTAALVITAIQLFKNYRVRLEDNELERLDRRSRLYLRGIGLSLCIGLLHMLSVICNYSTNFKFDSASFFIYVLLAVFLVKMKVKTDTAMAIIEDQNEENVPELQEE